MEKILPLAIGLLVVIGFVYFIFAPHPEKDDTSTIILDEEARYDGENLF